MLVSLTFSLSLADIMPKPSIVEGVWDKVQFCPDDTALLIEPHGKGKSDVPYLHHRRGESAYAIAPRLLQKSALVGAAGLGLSAAAPSLAASAGKVADLTHLFNDKFPTFHGNPPIMLEANKTAGYQSFRITLSEHSGTHIDAPLHFIPDGTSVDELPVENLVCPLAVLDVKAKAHDDANYMVTPDDIETYMTQYGAITSGSCVAMNSGWASKVNDPSYRNDADGNLAFPGFLQSCL